jgi:predicted  nucleic acid-binding Zn-ribbon protein
LFSLTVFAYQNSDAIVKNIRTAVHQHFPCAIPLTYSLGTFDARFGLSREEFLTHITTSEKAWEDVVNKELFRYVDTGGDLTVNLIYDERQETTNKLQAIGGVIDGKKDTYESLKAEYEKLSEQLRQQRATYNAKLGEFQAMQSAYEKEVARWNKRGGAPEEEYARLEKQRAEINARVTTVNTSLAQLNKTVTSVNTLGTKSMLSSKNSSSMSKNITQQKVPTEKNLVSENTSLIMLANVSISTSLEIYCDCHVSSSTNSDTRSVIDHVTDPEAIMYRLNQGQSSSLNESDIAALQTKC